MNTTADDALTGGEQQEQAYIVETFEWLFDPEEFRARLNPNVPGRLYSGLPLSLMEQVRTRANAETRAKCAGLLRQGAVYLIGLADELAAPPAAPAQGLFDEFVANINKAAANKRRSGARR
jgi:hypothetical protein